MRHGSGRETLTEKSPAEGFRQRYDVIQKVTAKLITILISVSMLMVIVTVRRLINVTWLAVYYARLLNNHQGRINRSRCMVTSSALRMTVMIVE